MVTPLTLVMEPPLTLSSREVAALLHLQTATFYRLVTGLKRDHGFPAPLPGSRRYSRAQVVDWIRRGGAAATAQPATAGLDAEVAACEARLLARAGEMAGE